MEEVGGPVTAADLEHQPSSLAHLPQVWPSTAGRNGFNLTEGSNLCCPPDGAEAHEQEEVDGPELLHPCPFLCLHQISLFSANERKIVSLQSQSPIFGSPLPCPAFLSPFLILCCHYPFLPPPPYFLPLNSIYRRWEDSLQREGHLGEGSEGGRGDDDGDGEQGGGGAKGALEGARRGGEEAAEERRRPRFTQASEPRLPGRHQPSLLIHPSISHPSHPGPCQTRLQLVAYSGMGIVWLWLWLCHATNSLKWTPKRRMQAFGQHWPIHSTTHQKEPRIQLHGATTSCYHSSPACRK